MYNGLIKNDWIINHSEEKEEKRCFSEKITGTFTILRLEFSRLTPPFLSLFRSLRFLFLYIVFYLFPEVDSALDCPLAAGADSHRIGSLDEIL